MYFGPDVNLEQDGDQVSNKDLIKIGYKRVMEKTKELRQKFSKAVTNGTRSGSGKLVMEFYDDLYGEVLLQQNHCSSVENLR